MNTPLIDFDKDTLEPLSKVAIEVMNKLEKATGWLVTPRGKRKDREEAIASYIKSIEETSNMPPLAKAAFIAEARKTLRKYCNLNDIANMAIEQMESEAEPVNVDEDWLQYFREHAENISRSDAQILWAKVLAGECDKPGSIPKLLVHILSVMSEENAKKFETLCDFIVEYIVDDDKTQSILVLLNEKSSNLLDENGLDYLSLKNLDALGLISMSTFDARISYKTEGEKQVGFFYGPYLIDICFKGKELPIGYITLTEVGVALSNLIQKKRIDGFLDYITEAYQSEECEVKILPATYKE